MHSQKCMWTCQENLPTSYVAPLSTGMISAAYLAENYQKIDIKKTPSIILKIF